jgi:alpha-ketoglutarate-dependent taurine dioxygenase
MTIASGITITPLPATLGATVTGIRLAALDDAGWRAVEAGFHAHGLLIFPGQHLSDEEQQSFGRRFGRLEPGLELVVITNLTPDGRVRPLDDIVMDLLRGNEGWHTDSSYMPLAAKASMLSAHVVPSRGGETEWADMRAAYEALDERTRVRVGSLSAFHSIRRAQGQQGLRAPAAGYGYDVDDPPLRPLVKTHPVTGRPALFIGRHAHGVPGLTPPDSERLLGGLLDGACRAPRVHRHRWTPGDVAVWDNRCVLHRACTYDYGEPRVMKHTRIAGEPTERAPS